MGQSDQLIRLGPWPKGMNNALPDYELPDDVLRDIRNADVLDSGMLRRRKGYASVRAGSDVHSLVYHRSGKFLVWSEGGQLLAGPNPTVVNPTVLVPSGFTSLSPIYYDLVDDVLFYSDGTRKGKITASMQHRPWGLEFPQGYSAASTPVGGFKAGRYMVACSFQLADGEESAIGPVVNVDVAENDAINVTNIPVPVDPLITLVNIYVSEWNSEMLYAHTVVAAGVTSALLVKSLTQQGSSLRTAVGSVPMPAGKFVTNYNGRMFVAIGKFVLFSEPFYYGITRPQSNFYGFGSDVNMIVETLDGLYIGSDKTYFLPNAGDKEAGQKEVLAYGAIPHSVVRDVDNVAGNVAWFSERGFVIAGPGGQVKNVMDDAIAPRPYDCTQAFWRAQDGIKQLVGVTGTAGAQDAFVASDFIDAELVRGVPNAPAA